MFVPTFVFVLFHGLENKNCKLIKSLAQFTLFSGKWVIWSELSLEKLPPLAFTLTHRPFISLKGFLSNLPPSNKYIDRAIDTIGKYAYHPTLLVKKKKHLHDKLLSALAEL